MKLIRHNAIDNFAFFSEDEKQDLLVQEICKCFVLYPKATADILDTCNVSYDSMKPKDLSLAIEKNGGNLKMLNRLVRLSFLVNQKGDVSLKGHDRNMSYRDVMRSGKPFVKSHNEVMKDATLLTRDMMSQKFFSKMLGENVKTYCNLDGQGDKDAPKESNIYLEEKKGIPTWLWISVALVVVGVYFYKKSKNTEIAV
jgi:hypothetical protein